jgi:hypothetical protein
LAGRFAICFEPIPCNEIGTSRVIILPGSTRRASAILEQPEASMNAIRNGIVAVILLCFAGTTAVAASPQPSVPNELPRSWSIDEIALQTPPYETPGRVYVLAWSITEDDRPLRVESCLALKVLADGRYGFAHLYRRPDQPADGWRIASTHVAADDPVNRPGRWLIHTKLFDRRPTNREIYAAMKLEELDWQFDLKPSWRFVGCGVCEQSWLEALGEKPTRFFGN